MPSSCLARPTIRRLAAALACAALLVAGAHAQTNPVTVWQAAPQNVLTLSAEASREVPQDLLSITLAATREGADAAAVQAQLRQALDGALAEARKAARPGLLDVRTGAFQVMPRYAAPRPGSPATIAGWQGRADLVLEGSDTAAISQLAGRLSGLAVQRVGFSLSREARDKVEAEVAAQAIDRFKARAAAHAQQFGYASYSLREVAVTGSEGGGPQPVPMFRVAAAPMAGGDQAQPVEAGRTTVTVTVNGSIQLSPR